MKKGRENVSIKRKQILWDFLRERWHKETVKSHNVDYKRREHCAKRQFRSKRTNSTGMF